MTMNNTVHPEPVEGWPQPERWPLFDRFRANDEKEKAPPSSFAGLTGESRDGPKVPAAGFSAVALDSPVKPASDEEKDTGE